MGFRLIRHITLILGLLVGINVSVLAQSKGKVEIAPIARAEEIVQNRCFICHGMQGESSSPLYPRLAGQHSEYMVKQLSEYQADKRKSTTMQPQVTELTLPEMRALGAYFEKQDSPPSDKVNKDLAEVGRYIYRFGNSYSGVPACMACHGENGMGTAQLPRLANQRSNYLSNQLKLFNKRERTNDNEVMHSIASKLSELEIYAVAEYISILR